MRNTHRSLLSCMSISVFMTLPARVNAIPSGYTLVKADEFNGTFLDTILWIPSYLSCRTTEERAAARYSFKDSCLVLRIDKDQPTYYSNNAMKVSSIQTGQRDYLHKDEYRLRIYPIYLKKLILWISEDIPFVSLSK